MSSDLCLPAINHRSRSGSVDRGNKTDRTRILPRCLTKIDGDGKVLEFRGFPCSLEFDVGGKYGNIVVSSRTPTVLKGWRIVAVNGGYTRYGNTLAAISAARMKSRKFTVTFRFGDEILEDRTAVSDRKQLAKFDNERVDIESDRMNSERLERERLERDRIERERLEKERLEREKLECERLEREKLEKERLEREKLERERLEREKLERERLEREKLESERLESENATRVRVKAVQEATGLPARSSVGDPTTVLFAAMSGIMKAFPEGTELSKDDKNAGPCDKCDGPHHESACPHFRGKREKHRDATEMYERKKKGSCDFEDSEGGVASGDMIVHRARVVSQPGDGSCLFHSLSYGLNRVRRGRRDGKGTETARTLRRDLENYISTHSTECIGGTPIEDWILWESQTSVESYTNRMRESNDWGGAIEIAVCARVMGVTVDVYERMGSSFKRISHFTTDNKDAAVINVLYCGRCHYDALETLR